MPTISAISGAVRVSFTVWLSMASTAPSLIFLVFSSTSVPIREAIELPSTVASHQRSMLWTTSADVKSSPLFHFTP